MLIFLDTRTTSRGGLGASMKVQTLDGAIEEYKNDKRLSYSRFGEVPGSVYNISQMKLEVFEKYILPKLPDVDFVEYFSKEIQMKYGKAKERKEAKRISKKDLEVGCKYETENGYELYYLGKIRKTYGRIVEEGYGFESYKINYRTKPIKSIKKLIRKIEGKTIELQKEIIIEDRYGGVCKIEFLDL